MYVRVREAEQGDAESIAPLLAQLDYPSSVQQVRGRLARLARTGSDAVLVAEQDDQVVGVAVLHLSWMIHMDRPTGRLMTLVVDESSRGSGIGRALVDECCRRAEKLHCARLELTSKLAREESHTFYERVGFEHTAERFTKPIGDE
jgi:N-acetylglutamate synthase-like GNAT family acetyltransferase